MSVPSPPITGTNLLKRRVAAAIRAAFIADAASMGMQWIGNPNDMTSAIFVETAKPVNYDSSLQFSGPYGSGMLRPCGEELSFANEKVATTIGQVFSGGKATHSIGISTSVGASIPWTLGRSKITRTGAAFASARSSPVTRIPRGGAGPKPASKESSSSGSMIETVNVVQVLQGRTVPWLDWLRRVWLAVCAVCIYQVLQSVGVPYAASVWSLLHDPTEPMPRMYTPSQQAIRLATKILEAQQQTTSGITTTADPMELFPPEYLPSFFPTGIAVASVVIAIILYLACPSLLQECFAYQEVLVPLQSSESTLPLALKVQVEQLHILSNDNDNKQPKIKVKRKTFFRRIAPMNNSDNKKSGNELYQLDLDRDKSFSWNPSNGKLTKL